MRQWTIRMKEDSHVETGVSEPVVTTYRANEVTGPLAEAIARTGAQEGDGLVIEQNGEEIRVRRVAPLVAGRVYRGREFVAAMKARLGLR